MLVWHRRAGKSKTLLNEQIRKAILTKGIYYYVLPTYKQAKQVIWDELIKEHLPSEVVTKVNDSELAVYYRNGSIQRFVGCEDVDKHRGTNPIDVTFDEFSEEPENIWLAVFKPILDENGGTASFGFTPKGRNHAWKMLIKGREDPRWFTSVKTIHDTNTFTPERIIELSQEYPEALFKQEYECQFIEGAGQFFNRIDDNLWSGQLDPEYGHQYALGADLAKYRDWTVLTPFDLNNFKVGLQERFNQVDWHFQKAKIANLARKYNNAIIKIDQTGVGDPIVEDLQRELPTVEGLTINRVNRRQLLDNLRSLLSQDKIKIPNDPGLLDELRSMTFKLQSSEAGLPRLVISVPEGMTDDRVFSLALAVWNATNPIRELDQPEFNIYTDII